MEERSKENKLIEGKLGEIAVEGKRKSMKSMGSVITMEE